MDEQDDILQTLEDAFGDGVMARQPARDGIPTLWVSPRQAHDLLHYLKTKVAKPYRMLYDLTAIDERVRVNRHDQPDADFTVVYHLLSFERNSDVRVKVALKGETPTLPTVTDIWTAANWYEREV